MDDPATSVETLWAAPLGDNLYRIENIPFIAYGISLDDVVSVTESGDRPTFHEVVRTGGHRTFRVLAVPTTPEEVVADRLRRLERLGCGLEQATPRYWAIDVPESVSGTAVVDQLEDGWQQGLWQYEDAAQPL